MHTPPYYLRRNPRGYSDQQLWDALCLLRAEPPVREGRGRPKKRDSLKIRVADYFQVNWVEACAILDRFDLSWHETQVVPLEHLPSVVVSVGASCATPGSCFKRLNCARQVGGCSSLAGLAGLSGPATKADTVQSCLILLRTPTVGDTNRILKVEAEIREQVFGVAADATTDALADVADTSDTEVES